MKGLGRVYLALALLAAAAGCAALQSGAAAACQLIDSGNPVIGSICLTIEEATSVVRHAKASRARMKATPTGTRTVDICDAPVTEPGTPENEAP